MYYDFFAKLETTSITKIMINRLNKFILSRILTNHIKEKIKLLEIGHGRGLFAQIAKDSGKVDYYGIEPNKSLCSKAQSDGFNIKNMKIPPFPEDKKWKKFDTVFISHVLEHFVNYEVVMDVLNCIHNLLNENGLFVLFFPDYLDYKEDYFVVDYSHEYILVERRVKYLLIDCGFDIINTVRLRSCFKFPFNILIYPLHTILKFIAGILYNLTGADIFFKIKITFGKNVLIISKKSSD